MHHPRLEIAAQIHAERLAAAERRRLIGAARRAAAVNGRRRGALRAFSRLLRSSRT
jgi:hypothetical protein